MSGDYSLLKEYEWLGEFWLEGEEDKKFPGLLTYAPEKGISIRILRKNADFPHHRIPGFDRDENKSVTIFGYTQDAGKVSLFDCMPRGDSSGNLYSTEMGLFCGYAVLGGHFPRSHLFRSFSMRLNNLNEFCYPQGFKMDDVLDGYDVCKSEVDNLSVSICKTASGSHIFNNRLSSLLLDVEMNDDFKDELDAMAQSLSEKHNVPYFVAKSNIDYKIYIESTDGAEFMDFILESIYIRHLFSFLMLKQIVPLWMYVKENPGKSSAEYVSAHPVLMSLYLTDKQVAGIIKDKDHRWLPVNLQGIKDNFSEIYPAWRKFRMDDMNLVLHVVLDHIENSRFSIHKPAIIISAMEQWFYKYSGLSGTKKDKYEKVIAAYSSDQINTQLESCIPFERTGNVSLGGLITHVRTAILHPGSDLPPIKAGASPLGEVGLANIAEMLYIIIVLGVYTKIGVSEDAISNVRESYKRFTALYRSAKE
jgi:hypothetical protein